MIIGGRRAQPGKVCLSQPETFCSMHDSMPSESQSVSHPPTSAARQAGIFLVLTAFATLAAVLGRVAADADQPTLLATLQAIADNRFLYGLGGGARLISGLTLGVAAWLLLQTWIIRERLGSPLVPVLFGVSGIFTAISGACAVAMAAAVPPALDVPGVIWETTAVLRATSGKVGFAAAGLALIVAARYQWRVGGMLQRIAPISVLLGGTLQFIWVDSAIQLHRYTGALLLLWFLVIGSLLLTGRVEQLYRAMHHARSTRA